MGRRILPLCMVTALIGLWFLFLPERIETEEERYPLSNNPEENTALVLKGKSLMLLNLPGQAEFNYVLLKLVDGETALPAKKSRNVRKAAYDVLFDLRGVPNGSYAVEIYNAAEEYAAYHSYIRSQVIGIIVDDFRISFVESVTLENNREVFAENPYDDAAVSRYLEPSAKIQSDHPDIIDLARRVTAWAETDYDKVKAVHDWVCDNIWYDYDALHSGVSGAESALETLNARRGVCIGYASLTAALLRAVGIPASLEAGYVLNTSVHERWTEDLIESNACNHVWNQAYADGRWIILDTSYDSGNTYKNKEYSAGTGLKNRKYFDITIEFLSADRYIAAEEWNPVGSR